MFKSTRNENALDQIGKSVNISVVLLNGIICCSCGRVVIMPF